MATAFENFVNTELPKRIGTNENPTTVVAGKVPVYTGVGLLTEAQEVEDIVPSEVLWYPDLASFPVEGELEKLYVAEDTDTVYRWKGSSYAIVGSSLELGETSTTAYRGDRGKAAYDHSQATGNPHGTAITDISGLQAALNGKEPTIASGTSSQYIRGDKSLATLNTDAVPETASRVYLSPAQKTIATQAATATLSGYLSSTDWNTFNSKQAALANVITAGTYGNITQYPVITVNTKGIVTSITLQTVPTPTFTDATFSVQKNGSPAITASWSLTALTASVVHTYPDKDIDFATLPSIGASDGNVLSGTRTRIVGGSGNTVSGTDNIIIGGIANTATGSRSVLINCSASVANSDVIALNGRHPGSSNLEANSILLGTSKQTDIFKNIGTAAALRLNALYALSSDIPISGTLYATIDGSQTLSASNLVLGVVDTGDCATHEVEFMVCVGAASGFGGVLPTGYFIAKRRIVAFRHAPSGTFYTSAVQTIGTDVTLGTLGGTITPDLSIDTTTGSATIGKLRCKIDRTGGVAGQEVVAMSVRVASHHSR